MGSISHEQAWGVSPPRIKSKQMVTENSESPEAEKKDSPKKLPSTPGLASRQPYPISDPETPDLLNFETRSPETVRDIFDPSGKFEDRSSGFPHRSRIATPKVTPHRVSGELTGHRSNIINPVVKGLEFKILGLTFVTVTSPTERVVGLERVLGYHGGPTVSLYNGEMLAVPCGSIIVLLDIRAKDALEGLQPPFRREKYGQDSKYNV